GESEPPDRRGRRHGRPARVKPSSRKTSQSWPDGHATKTTTIRTPGRGCRSSPRARCRGAYVLLHIPGVHFRSLPAKLPAPFQGAQAQLEKYVTVFMKSCS